MKCHIDEMKQLRVVPSGVDLDEQRHDALDFVVYLYLSKYRPHSPCALAFRGRGRKPWFHNRYGSVESRREAIDSTIEAIRKDLDQKLEWKNQKKAFVTTLKPGDLIFESWGYDQTNVYFHQVIRVPSPKTVITRKLNKKTVESDGGSSMSANVIAIPNDFASEKELKCRVSFGENVKVDRQIARPWDGKPKYCSWYA